MSAPIKLEELYASWNRHQWKPVYLFAGAEDFLMEEALSRAQGLWLADDPSGLNLDRMDGDTHSGAEILQTAQTVPFLGGSRLVRVTHAESLSAADQTLLAQALSRLPADTHIIFLWQKDWRRDDLRKPLVEAILERGNVVIFWTLFPSAAVRWASERSQKTYAKTLAPQAAAWLVEQAGESLRRMDQELAKCSAMVGKANRIELEDMRTAFGYSRAASPFDWIAFIRQKHVKQSTQMLERLLDEGEEPLRLLALLSRNLRDWLSAVGVSEPPSGLALRFHLRRGEENQMAKELRRWTEEELMQALRACVETEQAVKTGKETPDMALTLLGLSLGGLKRPDFAGQA